MKFPFVYLLIPYVLGIVIINFIELRVNVIFFCILLILLFLILSIYIKKGFKLVILILFIFLGGLGITLEDKSSVLLKYVDTNLIIKSHIKDIVSEDDGYSRYFVNVKEFYIGDVAYKVEENSILRVKGKEKLAQGDEIVFNGIIKMPNEGKNPGFFNYKNYLKSEKIYVLLDIYKGQIKVISNNNISRSEEIVLKFRKKIWDLSRSYLGHRRGGIISSILLGDTSYLDNNLRLVFRDLGISHVFAVSGLHVGIISVFLIFVLGSFRISRKLSIIITITIIWIYGYLIGYPTSVLRSLIMFSLLMTSTIIHKRYNGVNVISLSALILLLYNPYYLFSLGFQLSFAATLSLLILTKKVDKLLFNNLKVGRYIAPVIAVQIGIIPILIYHFNKVSLSSFIINPIIIPIVSIALVLGMCMVILSFISSIFTLLISKLLIISLYFIDILSLFISKIPYGSVGIKTPSISGLMFYYLVVLLIFKVIDLSMFSFSIKKVVFSYLVISLTIIVILDYSNPPIYIDFIDVGQGDSILIRYKNKNFLVDVGGVYDYDNKDKVISLEYLKKQGITKLSGVFISHFHQDHAGGILSLLEEIKIKNIFIGYVDVNNEIYNRTVKLSSIYNTPIKELDLNDEIKIGKNFSIKALYPYGSINVEDDNNNSLVLLLRGYKTKILFTGDIEAKSEKEIIEKSQKSEVDILKVPHHGSNTSSSYNFINYFNPKYAVISVGKNFYGHPNKEVIDRYNDKMIDIFRTDTSGLVKVVITKGDFKIKKYIGGKYSLNDIIDNHIIMILSIIGFLITIYISILSLIKVSANNKDFNRRGNYNGL